MIKSRNMRWAGNASRMGEKIIACGILFGKPEGNKPLGRSKRRWENTKLDFREIGWGVWTALIWLRIGTGGFL
jgi:hypothetical protein